MSVAILLFSVFIASLAQILLKISANKKYDSRWGTYMNLHVIVSYGLFFISTVLTIIALREIELKNVQIVSSIGYIYILVLGKLFLREDITKNKVLGNIIIIAGVVIFNL